MRVDVHAHLNGTLAVSYRGQPLPTMGLPPRSRSHAHPDTVTSVPPLGTPSLLHRRTLAADHPWRWGTAAKVRRMQLHLQGEDIFTNPLE